MIEPFLLYLDQAISALVKGPRLAKTSLWRKRNKPIDNIGDGYNPAISIKAAREEVNAELSKIQLMSLTSHT